MNDRPSALLGNIADPEEVRGQVCETVQRFAPGHDLARIEQTFAFLQRAFRGELAGYAPLKTLYHNASHTNEVVLCAARVLHGLHLSGRKLDAEYVDAALVGALMHDFGYLMRDEEAHETATGAQFTSTHVARGEDFIREQLGQHIDLPDSLRESTIKVVQLTDHRQPASWVQFDNPQQQLAAYATATADLVGQMANGQYLERLLLLFFEFQEAQIPGFGDIHQLMEKTADFYRLTRTRIDQDLEGLVSYLRQHFRATTGEDRNLYLESIDRNLSYLDHLVHIEREHRLDQLKRGHIVDALRRRLAQPPDEGQH